MTLEEYIKEKTDNLFDECKDDIIDECRQNGGHITVEAKFYLHIDEEFKGRIKDITPLFYEEMKSLIKNTGIDCHQGKIEIKESTIYDTLLFDHTIVVAGVFDHRVSHIDVMLDDKYLGKDKLVGLAESNAYETFKKNKNQIEDGMRKFSAKIDIEDQYHLRAKRRDYIRAFDKVMKRLLNDAGVVLEGSCTLSYPKDDPYNLTMSYLVKRVEKRKKK